MVNQVQLGFELLAIYGAGYYLTKLVYWASAELSRNHGVPLWARAVNAVRFRRQRRWMRTTGSALVRNSEKGMTAMAHHNIPDVINFFGAGTEIVSMDGQWNITIRNLDNPVTEQVISLTADQVLHLFETVDYAMAELFKTGRLP